MFDELLSPFMQFRLASLLFCVVVCVDDVSSWPKDPDEAMRNAIHRFLDDSRVVDYYETAQFTTYASNVHSTSVSTLQPTLSAYRSSVPSHSSLQSPIHSEQPLQSTFRSDQNAFPASTTTSTSGPAMRIEPPALTGSWMLSTEAIPLTLQMASTTVSRHKSTDSLSLPISSTTTASSTGSLDDSNSNHQVTTPFSRKDAISTRSNLRNRTHSSENNGRSSKTTDDDVIVRTVDLFRIFALHSLPSDDLRKQMSKSDIDGRLGLSSATPAQKNSPIQTTRRPSTISKDDAKSSWSQAAPGFTTHFGRHFWTSGEPLGERYQTEAPESASGHVVNRQLVLVIGVVGSLAVSGAFVALVSSLMSSRCRPTPPYTKSNLNRKKSIADRRPEAEAAAAAFTVVVVVDKDAGSQLKQPKQSVTSSVCCLKPPSSAERQRQCSNCCLHRWCCFSVTTSTQASAIAAAANAAGTDVLVLNNQNSDSVKNEERKGGDGVDCGLEKGENLDNNMNVSKCENASEVGKDGNVVGDQHQQGRQTSTVRQMIESFDRKCRSTSGSTGDKVTSTNKSKHGGRLYVPKRSTLQTAGSNNVDQQQTNIRHHHETGSTSLLKTTKVVTFADPVDYDDVQGRATSGDNKEETIANAGQRLPAVADSCQQSFPLKVDVATLTANECDI